MHENGHIDVFRWPLPNSLSSVLSNGTLGHGQVQLYKIGINPVESNVFDSYSHTLEIILYNIHYLIEQNSIVLSYPRHLAAGNTKTLKKIFFPIFNYIQN